MLRTRARTPAPTPAWTPARTPAPTPARTRAWTGASTEASTEALTAAWTRASTPAAIRPRPPSATETTSCAARWARRRGRPARSAARPAPAGSCSRATWAPAWPWTP
ncbi:MAG: hypothetical protein EVA89_27520, partial [Sandaracinaceae bacterium]